MLIRVLFAACGRKRNSRIVGGNVTNIYNYPWLVSLTKMGNFYCAGTVITRKHLLTAAHCLRGLVNYNRT